VRKAERAVASRWRRRTSVTRWRAIGSMPTLPIAEFTDGNSASRTTSWRTTTIPSIVRDSYVVAVVVGHHEIRKPIAVHVPEDDGNAEGRVVPAGNEATVTPIEQGGDHIPGQCGQILPTVAV
jgi:hypothetical protein